MRETIGGTMQPKIIDTTKYTRQGKVLVDGKEWTVVLPGAGKELEFSKMQRRVNLLEKKIQSGEATEQDLDRMDAFEDKMLDFFKSLFRDSTEDNSEVDQWVNDTPMAVIIASFEDIKRGAEEKDGTV